MPVSDQFLTVLRSFDSECMIRHEVKWGVIVEGTGPYRGRLIGVKWDGSIVNDQRI